MSLHENYLNRTACRSLPVNLRLRALDSTKAQCFFFARAFGTRDYGIAFRGVAPRNFVLVGAFSAECLPRNNTGTRDGLKNTRHTSQYLHESRRKRSINALFFSLTPSTFASTIQRLVASAETITSGEHRSEAFSTKRISNSHFHCPQAAHGYTRFC